MGRIEQINEPIDLEAVILKTIQEQEVLKKQIARYKARGVKALFVSILLTLVLAILYSYPSSSPSAEYASIMYVSITLALFMLLIQVELSGIRSLNQLKNNSL